MDGWSRIGCPHGSSLRLYIVRVSIEYTTVSLSQNEPFTVYYLSKARTQLLDPSS